MAQWISIKERKPNDRENVIVRLNASSVPAVYKHQRFWVRTDPSEPAGGHPIDAVTEWRPVEAAPVK